MSDLSDFPVDYNWQAHANRSDAAAGRHARRGYRPEPTGEAMRAAAGQYPHVFDMLSQVLENSRFVAFLSAVNDVPYRGNSIHHGTGRILIPAGGTLTVFSREAQPSHIFILREMEAETFDPSADADLGIRVKIDDHLAWTPYELADGDTLSPSEFVNRSRNLYSKPVMDSQVLTIEVDNDNAVVDQEIRLSILGWEFPVDGLGDNSRTLLYPK